MIPFFLFVSFALHSSANPMDRLVLMIGSQGVISLVTKDAKIDLVFSPDPRAEGQRIILRRRCGR
jgi:hypothetical protein